MALPFSQTTMEATCLTISLRLYLPFQISTYCFTPFAPKTDARIPPIYINPLDIFHVLKGLDPSKSKPLDIFHVLKIKSPLVYQTAYLDYVVTP